PLIRRSQRPRGPLGSTQSIDRRQRAGPHPVREIRAVHEAHTWFHFQTAGAFHPEHAGDARFFHGSDDGLGAANLVVVQIWILPAGEAAPQQPAPSFSILSWRGSSTPFPPRSWMHATCHHL